VSGKTYKFEEAVMRIVRGTMFPIFLEVRVMYSLFEVYTPKMGQKHISFISGSGNSKALASKFEQECFVCIQTKPHSNSSIPLLND
jgi:hypothetical protein